MTSPTPDILIVSQALADELFPDGDALGKTVWDEPNGEKPIQIIGIYEPHAECLAHIFKRE